MDNTFYCVILAGGVGARFWPYSQQKYPKQFIDFFGDGETLLQTTYRRFSQGFAPSHILVITNNAYFDIVSQQLPDLPKHNILLEPCLRNTAAAMTFASMHIQARCPEATIVFAPSDHLIRHGSAFASATEKALTYARDHHSLVTLGIRPTYPETGYGYIQIDSPDDPQTGGIYPVKAFTEKPNKHMCKVLIESGEFYWNSGLFFAPAALLISLVQTHLPEMGEQICASPHLFGTPQEQHYIDEVYPFCQNISFDYGVMEKVENVHMLLCDMGWTDLGTWSALYRETTKDEANNAYMGGKHGMFNDSHDNLVVVDDPKALVVLQGVSDLIVVKKENTLMICRRGEEHMLKQVVTSLHSAGVEGESYL